VNAPTSTGKSFILQNHLINSILRRQVFNAVYIVPTRALIEQVVHDLLKQIKALETTVNVTSVPNQSDEAIGPTIYVLTQEIFELVIISQL